MADVPEVSLETERAFRLERDISEGNPVKFLIKLKPSQKNWVKIGRVTLDEVVVCDSSVGNEWENSFCAFKIYWFDLLKPLRVKVCCEWRHLSYQSKDHRNLTFVQISIRKWMKTNVEITNSSPPSSSVARDVARENIPGWLRYLSTTNTLAPWISYHEQELSQLHTVLHMSSNPKKFPCTFLRINVSSFPLLFQGGWSREFAESSKRNDLEWKSTFFKLIRNFLEGGERGTILNFFRRSN